MPAKMMPGAPVADAVFADLEPRIEKLVANGHTPGLGTILVGDDGASERYVGMKMQRAQELGWASPHIHLPEDATQADLVAAIRRFNDADDVDAFLVQHPAPPQLDYDAALLEMDPDKDVDGMHPVNMGRLALDDAGTRALHARRDRGAARVLRGPGGGPRGVHPRARHHARPPARAAPLAEAADRERRGHRRAHRHPRLAALHAAGRHRDRRRRRPRHPPARAHLARCGRRRRRRALRGPQLLPDVDERVRGGRGRDHAAGRRRGSHDHRHALPQRGRGRRATRRADRPVDASRSRTTTAPTSPSLRRRDRRPARSAAPRSRRRDERCPACNTSLSGVGGRPGPFSRRGAVVVGGGPPRDLPRRARDRRAGARRDRRLGD